MPSNFPADERSRAYWDAQAATFDTEADHGLSDPDVRAAWTKLLLAELPSPPAQVIDLGCGTGSLSILLAKAGYDVRGLDFSGRMVAEARRKAAAAGPVLEVQQGDAAQPPYPDGSCDVVLARHLLWALPDPIAAVSAWTRLLRAGGLLIMVEGHWSTGVGLTAERCREIVLTARHTVKMTPLTDPHLWGKTIDDERYLLVSPR